jgi:uncharacterized protein YaaW (UPF0174 family)
MSDYTKTTNFTAKDALSSGDPGKLIKGSDFDTEFDALATAVTSKYDSDDIASQAQAEAGALNTVVMTPLRTEQWSATWAAENAGIVGDLQALADPAAHVLLGFDNTSNTGKAFANATNGGIALAAGTVALNLNDLTTDTSISAGEFVAVYTDGSKKITFANFEGALTISNLTGYDANKFVDHTAVSVIAGTGLTGGGTIASDRTLNVIGGNGITANADDIALNLNELGTETSIAAGDFIAMVDITDSGSQKITFANLEAAITAANLIGYDANEQVDHTAVSMTAGNGLTAGSGGTIASTRTFAVGAGSGITVNTNDVALTNVTAGAAQPVAITSGTFTFDLSSITELTIPNVTQSGDGYVMSNAGTIKVMPYDQSGIKVATVSGTTDLLAAADMNTFIEYTNASPVAVTLNTGVGTVGNCVIIKQTGAGQVTVSGTATLEASVAAKTRTTDSVISLVCIAANTWAVYGDMGA